MVKNSKLLFLSLCVLVVAAAGCGGGSDEVSVDLPAEPETPAALAAFDPATGTATVSGTVTLDGAAPKGQKIRMNADPNCVAMHQSPVTFEEVVASDGNLQNVFVYVKEGLEKYTFSTPSEAAQINQAGCVYTPHVGGIMVNQTLEIKNSDDTLHNIHCWAEKNSQFNIGQPIKNMVTKKSFDIAEIMIPFKCDVHKWMSSYLGVLPHPYFGVTGGDGSFSLANLPPGDYVLEAWHEKYGTQTQSVTVGDNEAKEANFSFAAG